MFGGPNFQSLSLNEEIFLHFYGEDLFPLKVHILINKILRQKQSIKYNNNLLIVKMIANKRIFKFDHSPGTKMFHHKMQLQIFH